MKKSLILSSFLLVSLLLIFAQGQSSNSTDTNSTSSDNSTTQSTDNSTSSTTSTDSSSAGNSSTSSASNSSSSGNQTEVSDSNSTSSSSTDHSYGNFLNSAQTSTEDELQSAQCYIYGAWSFFDLQSLNKNGSEYTAYSLTSLRTYEFNFCEYVQSPCGNANNRTYATSYLLSDSVESSCLMLTDPSFLPHSVDYLVDGWNNNITKYETYVQLNFNGGETCTNSQGQAVMSSVTYKIVCQDNITAQPNSTDFTVFDNDTCNPLITFKHKSGCAVYSASSIAIFFQKYPWMFAIVLIFFGPIINFWGAKFIPLVVGIVGGIFSGTIALLLCSSMGLLDYIDPTVSGGSVGFFILALVISIAVGTVVGILLYKFILVGMIILGFVCGWFCGQLLYNLVFLAWVESEALLYFTTFGLGAFFAFLAYWKRRQFMIYGTSLVGAYFFIRGISLFVGGFPNEVTLYQQLQTGQATFTTQFLYYLGAIGVLFLAGVIYQYKKGYHRIGENDDHYKKQK